MGFATEVGSCLSMAPALLVDMWMQWELRHWYIPWVRQSWGTDYAIADIGHWRSAAFVGDRSIYNGYGGKLLLEEGKPVLGSESLQVQQFAGFMRKKIKSSPTEV